MARIKRAAPSTGTPLDVNRTRLPLALKPSNSTTLCSSSSSSQELSPTTMKINTNLASSSVSQPSSLQLLPKTTELSSTTTLRKTGTMMKKTKSISKAQIIESKFDEEDNNSENDSEGQYDLTTSIEESGGIEKFLETPCMILYKRNLTNQGKLFVCVSFNDRTIVNEATSSNLFHTEVLFPVTRNKEIFFFHCKHRLVRIFHHSH